MRSLVYLVALFSLGIGAAHAQIQVGSGIDEAAAACGRASFGSDVSMCMAVVNKASYFDVSAANACGNISFSSSVPKCMAAVADKIYLSAEVSTCASVSFDNDKIKCFKNSGKPYFAVPVYEPRPSTDGFILKSLKTIETKIRRGRIGDALLDLAALIRFVEEGMKYTP